MGFSWILNGGDPKSFEIEPYDEPGFDIWGKEIAAPDGALYTYGAGLIVVKFKLLWIKNAKASAGKFGYQQFMMDWKTAQGDDHGQMSFTIWSPKDNSWATVKAIPRWPDPSGKFFGPYLRDIEIYIDAPNIPAGYASGPVYPEATFPLGYPDPTEEPPVLTPADIETGFGVGHFGYGDFGVGEIIYL